MNREAIVKAFNPYLRDKEAELVSKMSDQFDRVRLHTDSIENLRAAIIKAQSKLRLRLEQVSRTVQLALMGDKKFSTETYTYELPLEAPYFNPEAVQITSGILTPKIKNKASKRKRELPMNSLGSRKDTEFKIIGKKVALSQNTYFPYQEIEIKLPTDIVSGFLHLAFDTRQMISVLDSYGKEIEDTSVRDSLSLPISKDTKVYVIRFEDNQAKVFSIKDLFITDEQFEDKATFESAPIQINQELSEIALNTCDNYSDPNIDIKYELSVNGGVYREIRPLNKHKNVELSSVLLVDDSIKQAPLTRKLKTELGSMFITDELETQNIQIEKAFGKKLGANWFNYFPDQVIHFYIDKPMTLEIEDTWNVRLNGFAVAGKVELPFGYNTLSCDSLAWNQVLDVATYDLISYEGDLMVLREIKTGDEVTKVIPSDTKSLFLQLFPYVDLYSDPTTVEKVYIQDKLYLKADNVSSLFLFYKQQRVIVDRVRLKISMVSKDVATPAYISSITIRGV